MKKNIHFNILLLLLLVEAMTVHAFAQILVGQPQRNISFEEYLNSVGKNNLNYLAEKLNVSIADAEAMAAKVFPDPELGFEAGNETFSLGLSYSLELGNKRGARIKLARNRDFRICEPRQPIFFWKLFCRKSYLRCSEVLMNICCN